MKNRVLFNYWYPKDIDFIRKELDSITGIDKLIFNYMEYPRPQEALKTFIEEHKGEYDWLFLASTDVLVKQENIDKMLKLIENTPHKHLSGVMNCDTDGMKDLWNICKKFPEDGTANYDYVKAYSETGLIRVEHEGWALAALHRDVFEEYPKWYIPKWVNNAMDRRLNLWCKEQGIEIYADTSNVMEHFRFLGDFAFHKEEKIEYIRV